LLSLQDAQKSNIKTGVYSLRTQVG